jgi:hypothetical protein
MIYSADLSIHTAIFHSGKSLDIQFVTVLDCL